MSWTGSLALAEASPSRILPGTETAAVLCCRPRNSALDQLGAGISCRTGAAWRGDGGNPRYCALIGRRVAAGLLADKVEERAGDKAGEWHAAAAATPADVRISYAVCRIKVVPYKYPAGYGYFYYAGG